MTSDPFEQLGIDRNASAEEIKAAFRRMAKKYHPDITGDSGEKFKRILLAYERLAGFQNGIDVAEKAEWVVHLNIPRQRGQVQDVFDDLRDGVLTFFNLDAPEFLNLYLELNPDEARRGGPVKLIVPLVRKCRRCYGFGQIAFYRCPECGGTGEVDYKRAARITIPANVASGMTQRLKVDNLYLTIVMRVRET